MERIKEFTRPTVVQISLGADAPTQVLNYTAKQLYNSQDNLSAVVNFLANSIAQLPLKVYKRTDENRERDRKSVAARLLWLPNSEQTAYEFFRGLAIEYFVFGCVYVWVIPDSGSASGWQMRIIPSDWVTGSESANAFGVSKITVRTKSGQFVEIPGSELVIFKTYSAGNPAGYVSPVSALRQTLQEQIEAGNFRKQLWHSSGRLNAQIIRPANVQPWDEETRKRFIEAFREGWGANGSKAGSIPLLEDGMEIKAFNTNFRENQWAESIKLSREAVAAAYGINPSLIWHSDTQTYASSKDNARALYAECLGPIIQMIQQRINSFLLPMIGMDPQKTYVEFDLKEKLKGSFEERASILQSAVGGPWMTRNEARADNNLPPVEGGDELIIPLNVASGTMETETEEPEQDHEPEEEQTESVTGCFGCKAKADQETLPVDASDEEKEAVTKILKAFFERQKKSILPKIGSGTEWWNAERWNKELSEDLDEILNEITVNHGEKLSDLIGTKFIKELITAYMRKLAEERAKLINDETAKKVAESVDAAEEGEDVQQLVKDTFEKRIDLDATLLGSMLAKSVTGWATEEAVRQAKTQGSRSRVYKRWNTGPNSRASHAAMNGETVEIDEKFSNGANWPGDDNLSPEESCGCNCSTDVVIIRE